MFKNIGFWSPRWMQSWRNIEQNTYLKSSSFLTSIFKDFCCIFAPKLASQKVIFFNVFLKFGPRGAQEAPRGSQEPPRASQDRILKDFGSHSDSFFGWNFECSATHLLFYPMRFLYLVFPIGFSVIDVSCHIFSDFQR